MSTSEDVEQAQYDREFETHVIRNRVEAEHFGSWLLMKPHRDGGWSSEFWCRITAADGLLRVSGDFDPIVFQGHLSLTDDPISRVGWMGSHEGLDHYVIEKARTGSGEDACTQYDVDQAREDLQALIRERTTELEDEARDAYGDDPSEWPDDALCCSSIPAMQEGVDAYVSFSGREGVHEIVCAVWESEHEIDSETLIGIGESPSNDLRLAHAAVKRLHARLTAEQQSFADALAYLQAQDRRDIPASTLIVSVETKRRLNAMPHGRQPQCIARAVVAQPLNAADIKGAS